MQQTIITECENDDKGATLLPFKFDFKKPNYIRVFDWRLKQLKKIKNDPSILHGLKKFYKENPAQFITDWGVTSDPRNIERKLPALIPFVLFKKQIDWIDFILDNWKLRNPTITEKSREMGVSWLSVALACTLCLFNDGVVIGFGSRKAEYVDKLGDPKSLFHKAREFLDYLPKEFTGSWDRNKHAPYMLIKFPDTNSMITGESGDSIGRGNRTSLYFPDEAAYLQHPQLIDAALAETTNSRNDISTPNGMANSFARKRHSGKIPVFSFHWRDDPRKDEEWYKKKCNDIDDSVIIAQEVDLNYCASVDNILIPSEWVQAAIDAHIKLGIEIQGERLFGFDIADRGADKYAFTQIKGILIEDCMEWSGAESDILQEVRAMFSYCDERGVKLVKYDSGGIGAGVRGDAAFINSERREKRRSAIDFLAFVGAGEVLNPESPVYEIDESKYWRDNQNDLLNGDFFENFKAQSWWDFRKRFQLTYRVVNGEQGIDPSKLISISSGMENILKLTVELSQPTYARSEKTGKIVVNKTPEGAKSPNIADSAMMGFSRVKRPSMFYA
jgi:phage terminase large subunit